MEKNYMNPDSLVEFEFVENRSEESHNHENIELLFVLEGRMEVSADDQTSVLQDEDMILINAGRMHSYRADEHLLAVRFQISYTKIRSLLHQNTVLFWLNSVSEQKSACENVRKILRQILYASISGGSGGEIYKNSLYYSLLSELTGSFLLSEAEMSSDSEKNKDRMNEIFDYIRANYRDPISLQDVADQLYLSPTYLSKYIRRNSGTGFVELISQVRLGHAMEDLMYTDTSVTKIAMDNGFASVAALNKVFRDTYQTTPSEYRKAKKKTKDTAEGSDYRNLLKKTTRYLNRNLTEDNTAMQKQTVTLNAEAAGGKPYLAPFNRMVNAGCASQLLMSSCQKQILMFRDEAGISIVRFWNILDPQMYLDQRSRKKKINFSRLNEVLDFITENDLIPYIELRPKSMRLLSNAKNPLRSQEVPDEFESSEECREFYDAFCLHILKRYGVRKVSGWYFGLGMRQDTAFINGEFIFRRHGEEEIRQYLDEFELIASVFRSHIPAARIGGALIPVQHYRMNGLEEALQAWSSREQKPDFISVTSFPYQIVKENGNWYERHRTEMRFVMDDINDVRAAMDKAGFDQTELHVAECNLTLSDRSPLNDSLIRAAFIANTAVLAENSADMIGLWCGTDLYEQLADTSGELFGGQGMVTVKGLCKPAFHVLAMLNRLYRHRMYVSEDCLVTYNENDHIKILAHNLSGMNIAYYMKDESTISPDEIWLNCEKNEKKLIHVTVKNVRDHEWQVRRYRLNRTSGSVQDEWINLGMNEEIGPEEMLYLKRICTPRLYISKYEPENHTLSFDIELEPNEVQYLHITRIN